MNDSYEENNNRITNNRTNSGDDRSINIFISLKSMSHYEGALTVKWLVASFFWRCIPKKGWWSSIDPLEGAAGTANWWQGESRGLWARHHSLGALLSKPVCSGEGEVVLAWMQICGGPDEHCGGSEMRIVFLSCPLLYFALMFTLVCRHGVHGYWWAILSGVTILWLRFDS